MAMQNLVTVSYTVCTHVKEVPKILGRLGSAPVIGAWLTPRNTFLSRVLPVIEAWLALRNTFLSRVLLPVIGAWLTPRNTFLPRVLPVTGACVTVRNLVALSQNVER